ncbi:MAG: DUF6265 family protein [Saprospiraceae bacterium]|nr:DUF6265 family protein [Saprospiraceae bacterium]
MKNHLMMNKYHLSLIFCFSFLLIFQNCQNAPSENIQISIFDGEPKAVEHAEKMFKALGGKIVWSELRSLYIHAIHNEPTLEHPYESHIWRDVDEFKMRIEQRGPEFNNIGLFSNDQVEIQYVHRDSMRWFSKDALENEKYAHEYNVYVLFKKLVTQSGILVKLDKDDRLDFYENEEWLCGFILDEQNRPYRFFSPNPDGTHSESIFKIWKTINDYTHPAGGGPVDGNFEYVTKIWRPSKENIETAFDVEFQPKSFEMIDLDWLIGKWKREGKRNTIFEEWEKEGGSFVGKSYVELGNELKISETLEIFQKESETFYTPTVINQNEGEAIPFKMLGSFKDRFIFLNSEHDFPQKIVYRKIGKDSLKVQISGPMNDTWRKIDFDFEKVQ